MSMNKPPSCISFDSYIKPQPSVVIEVSTEVVYLLIPTSNHNLLRIDNINISCISFDSYIKPQLSVALAVLPYVVYLLIPTSNHNRCLIKWVWKWLYIF